MTTITDYFEQAQLSMAAYAPDLQRGAFGSQNTDYVTALKFAGMSQRQAEEFANQYRVVAQSPENDPTGFSATLFAHNDDGTFHIAIRGSANPNPLDGDAWKDWFGTNIPEVGFDGVAVEQGLALFNWLQQLMTPAGQPAPQVEYLPPDYESDPLTGEITLNELARIEPTTSAVGLGLLTSVVTVAGHSLGGHLAMLLSRLAPGVVSEVFTYNAPGFDFLGGGGLTSDGFFGLLTNSGIVPASGAIGSTFEGTTITGLNVDGDSVHEIGSSPGTQRTIFSESANQNFVAAHLKEPITDALALYSLFATLDPNLNNNPDTGMPIITDMLRAMASNEAKTLETALAGLETLFKQDYQGSSANHRIAIGPIDDPNDFYTRYFDLLEFLEKSPFNTSTTEDPSYGFSVVSLVGKSSTELASEAHTDIAIRYALYKLNPFAIEGAGLYEQINTDQMLDIYDPNSRTGNLTEEYLKDRSSFLVNKMASGLNNTTTVWGDPLALGSDAPQRFEDRAGGGYVYYGPNDLLGRVPKNEITQILFGAWMADNIEGGDEGDKLYGMGGDDRISGGGGDDYIEGGSGNDILIGGTGDDILKGGKGDDVYLVNPGDGTDRIEDKEGVNTVVLNGVVLKFFVKDDGQTAFYETPDRRFRGEYQGSDFIVTDTVLGNSVILNENFEDGDFGIRLIDRTTTPNGVLIPGPPGRMSADGSTIIDHRGRVRDPLDGPWLYEFYITTEVIYGDDYGAIFYGGSGHQSYVPTIQMYGGAGVDSMYADAGILIPEDQFTPEQLAWFYNDNAGASRLEGGELIGLLGDPVRYISNSYSGWYKTLGASAFTARFGPMPLGPGASLDGGAGDDWLSGGVLDDTLIGGVGIDVLYGNLGNDTLKGDGPGAAPGEHGSDWLDGGDGEDMIDGDGGRDVLIGGAGNDILKGGDGNDLLYGDAQTDYLAGWQGRITIGDHWTDAPGLTPGDTIEVVEGDPRFAAMGMHLPVLKDAPVAQSGSDYLDGGAGNDQLLTGAGDDVADGGGTYRLTLE